MVSSIMWDFLFISGTAVSMFALAIAFLAYVGGPTAKEDPKKME